MNERVFLSLIGVEVRRARKPMMRMAGMIAVAVVVLVAIGNATPRNVGILLTVLGVSGLGVIPSGVIRDKLGGSMEFLATLPVSASAVVGARFASAMLSVAPGAVMMAAASGLALSPLLGTVGRGRMIVVSFVVAWMVMTAVVCSAAGLLIRFNVDTLVGRGPLVLFALVVGSIYVFERAFGDPLQVLRAVMAHDQSALIGGAIVVLGTAAACAASFFLARQGVENYRPQPDSIEW